MQRYVFCSYCQNKIVKKYIKFNFKYKIAFLLMICKNFDKIYSKQSRVVKKELPMVVSAVHINLNL